MKKTEKVSFTVSRWAALAGIDRHNVQKGIDEIAAEPVAKATGQGHNAGEFQVRDLFRASHGDIDGQRLRKTTAEAERLEIQNAKSRRDLVPRAESIDLLISCGHDIRAAILALPIEAKLQDDLLSRLQKLSGIWARRAEPREPSE